jgi:hypothetical protein
MKKLSDFLVSYIIEDTPFDAPGTAIGTPGFSSPNMRPMFPNGTTGGSVGYTTGNPTPAYQPDYSYTDQRLGGMVKARQKDAQETLNRMRRVAARQAQGAGVDPGVESKIAELENQLSQRGYGRIEDEESEKLAQGRQRVASGTQLSNLPLGMFKTTPKTAAEQEAYDAAKDAMTLLMKRGDDKKTGAVGFSDDSAVERAFQTSREKSAAVDAERKAGSRISPVYQITQSDFKTATGRDYDPRNAQDRQVFFDLVSRGASTSSATAGPGEGPAYGSKEFYTMRQRPTDIPKFGTSDAWYDTETGQLARTTPGSRERTAQRQSAERIDTELAAQDDEINRQAQEIVRKEQEPEKKDSNTRQDYMDAIQYDLDTDGSRVINEPPGMGKYVPDPFAVQRGQFPIFPKQEGGIPFRQTLNKAAENVISSVGPKVSDFIKKNLAQTTPNAMREKLYGTTDVPGAVPIPDQERGQFPIFPETETDTEPEQIQQIKITPDMPEFKGYVVPESEEWNKLSEKEKLFMAATALTRGETAKFMGGRQKTEGGFLGIGGKKVNRFSEDQSGNTPAETAYLNRVSKMLNQLLDKDEQAAKEAREYGPEVETGNIQSEMGGGSTVNVKSKLPGNVGQYLDRVLGRKFTKFGSTKPETSPKPQAPNIDISNMRITNAPGNVRPYTGKEDPRFINPMTQYADILDPMRDRMLGRPMFATTSRRPKDFKPDNEGTMNAPLKLPGEAWTPEDIRRMKIIR